MGWIGLHVSPQQDPHCTLAWWPTAQDAEKAKVADTLARIVRSHLPYTAVASHAEFFGVRKNVEVAVLAMDGYLERMLWIVDPLNCSEFPKRPHVTAHKGCGVWTFRWVGLHLANNVTYWRYNVSAVGLDRSRTWGAGESADGRREDRRSVRTGDIDDGVPYGVAF